MDTSFYTKAPPVQEFNPAAAITENLNLRMLMDKQGFNKQLLEQELAQRQATVASTEEGTRKAVLERQIKEDEEKANKAAQGYYKQTLSQGYTLQDAHDEVYRQMLRDGYRVDTLSGLREKAHGVAKAGLDNAKSREEAKDKLLRQMDLEAAAVRTDPKQVQELMKSKMAEMSRLGFQPVEIANTFRERYGEDVALAGNQALGRVNAEMTPKWLEEKKLKERELTLAEAESAQRLREQRGKAGVEVSDAEKTANIFDKAIKGGRALQGSFTSFGGAWDTYFGKNTNNPDAQAIDAGVKHYNELNKTNHTVTSLGGPVGVARFLEQEAQASRGKAGALRPAAGAAAPTQPPAAEKPGEKPKMVTVTNLRATGKNGPATRQVPANDPRLELWRKSPDFRVKD